MKCQGQEIVNVTLNDYLFKNVSCSFALKSYTVEAKQGYSNQFIQIIKKQKITQADMI